MPHCGCHHKKNHCDYGCYEHQHQYSPIQHLLGPCEKVLFIGTYDINDRNLQGNISTIPVNLSINPNGYTIYNSLSYKSQDKSLPPLKFIERATTISTWTNSTLETRIGQLTMNALYKDDTTGEIVSSTIQEYAVDGVFGVFSKVNRAVIDFTNNPRVIYFIGKY